MKKATAKKFISGMLMAAMISASFHAAAAETGLRPGMSNGEKLKTYVQEQESMQLPAQEQKASQERILKEEQALQNHERIQEIVSYEKSSGKEGYVNSYGGSYINDDGRLVVQICGTIRMGKEALMKVTDGSVLYEQAANSYESLNEAIERDSVVLKNPIAQKAAGKLSGELLKLADAVVGLETRVKDNINVVFMTDISEEMQKAFVEYFGDNDFIFEKGNPVKPTAAFTLAQGDEIFIDESQQIGDDIIAGGSCASVGPRMKYVKADGSSVYGFLTAGHLTTKKGESIYYTKPNGKDVKIGTVYIGQYGGKVDASFVKVTNKNCTVSRYAKYVNAKGKTGQNYKMCAACRYGTPAVGQKVYKSGATSYLNFSTIEAVNVSAMYELEDGTEMLMEGLIMTATDMSEYGDSGSNVFYNKHGNVYETVGVVSGSTGTETMISDIRYIDEAWHNSYGYPLYQY